MSHDLSRKAAVFRDLHQRDGIFIMPNAWNAGSARLLAAAGFPAIGTTSAGVAYSNGVTDDGRVPGTEMMAAYRAIADAVDIPVSGDLETGYGDSPEAVAETIRQSIDFGMAGGSIEDRTGDRTRPLHDIEFSVARIQAARAAADSSGLYVLTARAECFLVGHDAPLRESIKRLNRYREAGADCLYAPGIKNAESIATLVREVDGPVNVVMGLAGASLSVSTLADIGVKRISIGGSLARATFGLVRKAATEMMEEGTFTFAESAIPDAEMSAFFAAFDSGRDRTGKH